MFQKTFEGTTAGGKRDRQRTLDVERQIATTANFRVSLPTYNTGAARSNARLGDPCNKPIRPSEPRLAGRRLARVLRLNWLVRLSWAAEPGFAGTRLAIPTLEALPHKSLPRGYFEGWCGQGGKVLLGTDNRKGTDVYDGEAKASPLTFPIKSSVQCGNDGRTLVFVDEEAGSASEVDVAAGVVTRTLATYDKNLGVEMSFSPDLKSVASSLPLTLVSKAVNLNVIVSPDISRFKWMHDSSAFFGLSASKKKPVRETVQIFDAQGRKIASGPLPAGFLFSDGWFANSQTLYLYLTPVHDEFGAGFMYRCTIAPWKCQQFASNVLDASAGGDGVLAMVRAVGKYSNDGETITFPPKYVAEIRDSALKVVAREMFKSGERDALALKIDPSGTRVAFAWYQMPPCPSGNPDDKLCRRRKNASMIDLSGVLK